MSNADESNYIQFSVNLHNPRKYTPLDALQCTVHGCISFSKKKNSECKTKIIWYLEAFWHISNYGGLFGSR